MDQSSEKIWLVARTPPDPPLPFSFHHIETTEALPNQGCDLIIFQITPEHDLSQIFQLRQKKAYQFTPIFYIGTLKEEQKTLFDGPIDDALLTSAKAINEKLTLIPDELKIECTPELALLIYLFSRTQKSLQGYLNIPSPFLYHYPILDFFIAQSLAFDSWQFLQTLVQRDLLIPTRLINEIQTCPHCHSGLLNFNSCCPSCHSIDIKSQNFIHCFSCGNIGPVNEFLNHEQLICNRCNSKLRHIGIDYDKPLEDKSCNQCNQNFIDAEINVVCLSCTRILPPEELESRRLNDFAITKRGQLFAQGLESKLAYGFNNLLKFVEFQSFMALIDWQKKIAQRYKTINFMLLGLTIINLESLILSQGLLQTENNVNELFSRVKQLLRQTDLATKIDQGILFLLPMTDVKGCEVIIDKVKSFTVMQVSEKTKEPLQIGISYISSDELIANAFDEELLLVELNARMEA